MTSTLSQSLARVAAVVAGLGLVAASFAPIASAQTSTTTTTTTTTSATFSRDLTLGSTGADVTALQNWLISKGHTIAAGATGYFGAQTRAALAAYQAANGITPAAGYFGPITRGKVMVKVVDSSESKKNSDQKNTDRKKQDKNERKTSTNNKKNTSVTSTARTQSVDGADNDVATFEMRVEIRAIGDDMYIPRNGSSAFTYQIENASTGAVVTSSTAETAVISSDADVEGDRYRIDEGDTEEFIVTVTFDPLSGDEGQSFRLQLLTVNFSSSATGSTEASILRSESKFQSASTFVAD